MDEKYRVLIVDDEESSRALIRLSIDWGRLGFEVVGEASNAEEALDFLEETPVDVVLTDIYMPYMNGIELSERMLEQNPDIKVIVITGHDNFEYAQQGIRLGVYDFIVKPIDEDEIAHTLENVHRSIRDEREIKASYGWLKKELPYLKEKFLVDLLVNSIEEQDYLQRKRFTDFHTVTENFQVTIIEISYDKADDRPIEEEDSYLCYRFLQTIKDIMTYVAGVEVYVDNTNNIVLLNSDQTNNLDLNNRLEMIRRRVLSQKNIVLTIGIGGWYQGYNRIKTSYKEAVEAVGYKVLIGANQVITYDDLLLSERKPTSLSDTWMERLTFYVKGGIMDGAHKVVGIVFDDLASQDKVQLKVVRLKAIQLMTIMVSALAEIGMNTEEKMMVGEESFEAVFRGNSLPEIRTIVNDFVEEVCRAIGSEQHQKQQSIIDKIHHYVKANLKEQLSLKIISDHFHLNKSYLSRIYKERTGRTLGEFILDQRMEKGKLLIKTTDMKAYEIAEEVGYLDPNYFGSSFKKYAGMSISDFRKKG